MPSAAEFGETQKKHCVFFYGGLNNDGQRPPPLVAVKIALAIFTGDKTMASDSLQSRPNNF